jgi:hypothetical protein
MTKKNLSLLTVAAIWHQYISDHQIKKALSLLPQVAETRIHPWMDADGKRLCHTL